MILSFGVVLDDGDALPIDLNRRSANRGTRRLMAFSL